TGVLEARVARRPEPLDQIAHHLLERGAVERLYEVDGARRRRSEERKVDVRLLDRAELVLRLLRGLLEALHRDLIALEIDARFFLEPPEEKLHDAVVEV